MPNIRQLKGIYYANMVSYFARPSLGRMTHIDGTIYLHADETQPTFDAIITHMPHIESLSFHCNGQTSDVLFAPLAQLQKLHTLAFVYPDSSFTKDVLDGCTSLRELTVCYAPVFIMDSLLSSTGARRLERLTLEHYWYNTITWSLKNLVKLRHLELREGIDTLINALYMDPDGLPALETLTFFPSTAKTKSHTRCEVFENVVRHRTGISWCLAFHDKKGFMSLSDDMRGVYEPVATAYPHRITIRIDTV
jgi:hypothetical protein